MEIKAVSDLVSKLNYDWFKEKKSFFIKETFYNKKHEKIVDTLPNSDYYEDEKGNFIEENRDIVLDIDLTSYCWYSDYPGSFQDSLLQNDQIPIDVPFDAIDIANEILSLIITNTEKFTEPKSINNYILSVIDSAKKTIKSLLVKNEDVEYEGVLDNFFSKTRKLISKKFYHIKHQVELSDDYEERLEFNLTQEELAALLYILNKAEVFNTINFNDTTFLHFCQQYFYFKYKGEYKRPTSFKTFSDKYREYVRGENGKTLSEIRDKLQKTLKGI